MHILVLLVSIEWIKALVSKETAVLCVGGKEKQMFGHLKEIP